MTSSVLISVFSSIPTWLVMLPILLCSLFFVAAAIERVIYYKILDMDYRHIMIEYNKLSGKKDNSSNFLLKIKKNAITDILLQYAEHKGSVNESEVVEYASGKAVRNVERFSGLVSTIATVSPMFGLFGTVTGMMKSFIGLSITGPGASEQLAYGIAEALITTATGLVVAIPALIFYNYMVSKSAHYIKEIEFIANSLLGNDK